MSTSIQDLRQGYSNCCGVEVYGDYCICSDCKEHCDIEYEEEEEYIPMHNIINEHNNRVELKRNRTHTKTFIGGVVFTLIVIYGIFPLADLFTDTLLAYLMK